MLHAMRYRPWIRATVAAAIATALASLAGGQAAADRAESPAAQPLRAVTDAASGRIDIREGDRPVLSYHYRTVAPPAGFLEKVAPRNRKYARPRSDYIHPLYGLDGEALTLDWSLDHPHHRGVYWAWPEVDYRGQRGDLHALQRVFARPTGKIAVRHEPGAVEIEAENHWLWDDKTPIVREAATIRVHRAGAYGRHIDLKLVFTALGDDVAIARRGATAYGGLNLRFSPIGKLDLVKHIDPEAAAPRRAWADAVGERAGGKGPSGVAILPRATNPAYPDDWIDFPALPWLQPAFPSPGVRWVLKKDTPLVLEYRLWVHRGGKQPDAVYREQWEAYNER